MSNLLYNVLPIPRRPIQVIAPDTTVEQCIVLMRAKDIGALIVMHEDSLLGIVSERDILRNCFMTDQNLKSVKAADIVYKDVPILDQNDNVEKAMQVMTDTKRRHILVTELEKVTAIISIGDIMYHLLAEDRRIIQHLEKYIAG